MSLSIGIVGLPNVGKSTLFNALTKKSVPAENFPFCTIDPSVGIVAVPDFRLEKLADFSKSAKKIPAAIEFVDIAGLVKGASEGEGLGNQFLSHIREVDAILHVVRIFEDEDIHHVHGEVDPLSDVRTIQTELILADLQTIERRLASLEKEVKRGDKKIILEKELLLKVQDKLQEGVLAIDLNLTKEEAETIKSLHLITRKPVLYALNKKQNARNLDELDDPRFTELVDFIGNYTLVDFGVEFELKDFDKDEKSEFRKELGGAPDDGIDEMIRKGYELLNLITFFTTGEDETRAWTIVDGSTAPKAGAAIHTDFEHKFIKAEIIFWNDLLEAGSYGKAREKGLVRTEGKEYVVVDGDVVEFKI
ncbi:MAG: redox-regulated ATPase YchF [Candidatus Pacebacteria bacterium]|nr:redox-regulated ATPase YchF [Candidatus Paceibacterota bacterium]